jgi:RNA polymerase sigma factor (sigma-70 family)
VVNPEGDGAGGPFPSTRWSLIVRARSNDPVESAAAREVLAAAYWKPVYKYIRARWNKSREDSEDLTQDFFGRLSEKYLFATFDPGKARLRTFLRMCVDRMAANEAKGAQRQKRGGGAVHVSLDFELAEREFTRAGLPSLPTQQTMEEYFEKEWIRSLFGMAVEQLRRDYLARGREKAFRVFERSDLEDTDERPSYEVLAREFGVAVSDVTNYLSAARRDFRKIALEKLREVTATEEEFQREANSLFGTNTA